MLNKKNWTVVVALVALMIMGFGITSTASAAGGAINGVNLGGNFRGGDQNPYYQSSFSNYENGTSASFLIFLDASEADLSSVNWNFSPEYGDQTQWKATCYMQGLLGVPASQNGQSWSQGADMGDYYVSASLGYGIWPCYPYDVGEQLCVNGSINLTPEPLKGGVVIDSTNFNYWPSTQDIWGWSNETDSWVVTESVPIWNAQLSVYGHFIPESATTSVPEPATMSLLALGGIALIRRKRS